MPEKHDLLAAILAAEQGIGATLRLQWRTFAQIMAVRLQNSNRRNDVRHYRPVHSWPLSTSAGLSSNLAYITSVFIGYIGTDLIGSLIKRFAAKKAGVEDEVEINNQRKAFLDMLARGMRELITDVRKPEIMVMTSL